MLPTSNAESALACIAEHSMHSTQAHQVQTIEHGYSVHRSAASAQDCQAPGPATAASPASIFTHACRHDPLPSTTNLHYCLQTYTPVSFNNLAVCRTSSATCKHGVHLAARCVDDLTLERCFQLPGCNPTDDFVIVCYCGRHDLSTRAVLLRQAPGQWPSPA